MKSTNVALLSLAGMLLVSASVYSLTPPGGAFGGSAPAPETTRVERTDPDLAPETPASAELGRFSAGSTLMVEGRVGHPTLLRSSTGETFVMLEIRGAGTGEARTTAPVNLSIVVDRSGSMKGSRIQNAISAA